MLIRQESDGLLIVSQPVHSWVSGQLARCWGNDAFGSFQPKEEVILAAELHDIGFLEWENFPTFNPDKHRPYDFIDLPFEPHLELWSHGVDQMISFGPYATVLVSMHVCALCRNYMHAESEAQREQVATFLRAQDSLQKHLLQSLRQDPMLASFATDEILERNRHLISTWDQLSLLLFLGADGKTDINDVPRLGGSVRLSVKGHGLGQMSLDPWPFSASELPIHCPARRIPNTFKNETEARQRISEALVFQLPLRLTPQRKNQ